MDLIPDEILNQGPEHQQLVQYLDQRLWSQNPSTFAYGGARLQSLGRDNGNATAPEHKSYRASNPEVPLTPEATWPTMWRSPVDLAMLGTTPRHNSWADSPDRIPEVSKGSHEPDVPVHPRLIPSTSLAVPASGSERDLRDRSLVDRFSMPSPLRALRKKRNLNNTHDTGDSSTPQSRRTHPRQQDQAALPRTPGEPARYEATVESVSESELTPERVPSEARHGPENPLAWPPRSQARRTQHGP